MGKPARLASPAGLPATEPKLAAAPEPKLAAAPKLARPAARNLARPVPKLERLPPATGRKHKATACRAGQET